jgi:hypothetical protein
MPNSEESEVEDFVKHHDALSMTEIKKIKKNVIKFDSPRN